MVNFQPPVVPRLRLPMEHKDTNYRKLPFDAYGSESIVTPKICGPTDSGKRLDSFRFPPGKIPNYAGHLPGMKSSSPSGKSFTYLSKLNREELDLISPPGFPKNVSPGPWSTTYRRHYTEDGPRQAFSPRVPDSPITKAEEDLLTSKFRRRRHDGTTISSARGEQELRQLNLVAGPLTSRNVEVRMKPAWVVECGWITPRTNRITKPEEEIVMRPCSPEGRQPNRESFDFLLVASYLQTLGYPDKFDPDLDKTYSSCDPNRGFVAGEMYETPKGWLGFGLRIAEKDIKKGIFQHWHTVYYPCPAEFLSTVLATSECVMPGDKLLNGNFAKICFMSQRDGVEKRDEHTPRKLGSCTRISTTPSIRYALLKLIASTRNGGFVVHEGKRLSFVLQCKQMGGSPNLGGYHRAAEAIGFVERNPRGSRISPYFENSDIENYALRKASVVPYRLLVKVEDADFMPAWTASGEKLLVPRQSQKELKWTRSFAPAYGSQTLPGLKAPFIEFTDPTLVKRNGDSAAGVDCPKPSAPFFTFPENGPIRDRHLDPKLKPSTQPVEPEVLVKPSSGWLEGYFPATFKNIHATQFRSVKGVIAEMKEKFSANANSLDLLFKSLAKDGDGEMHKSDMAVILLRMNIVKSFDEPIIDDLWHTLDADNSGSVSVDEFASKFGLFGGAEMVMDTLKKKIGARFNRIGQAFRRVDEDKSNTIEKNEFLQLLKEFNLLDGFPLGSDEEIWTLLDRDGSGSLSYEEFVSKFSGGDEVQTKYGPESGTRVIVRQTTQKEGTVAHTVSAMCDEGTACFAQNDLHKAEECYRRALQLDPNHVVSLCCLAWLLLNHKNDVLGSRGLMHRAADIDPHHPYVVWHKPHYFSG